MLINKMVGHVFLFLAVVSASLIFIGQQNISAEADIGSCLDESGSAPRFVCSGLSYVDVNGLISVAGTNNNTTSNGIVFNASGISESYTLTYSADVLGEEQIVVNDPCSPSSAIWRVRRAGDNILQQSISLGNSGVNDEAAYLCEQQSGTSEDETGDIKFTINVEATEPVGNLYSFGQFTLSLQTTSRAELERTVTLPLRIETGNPNGSTFGTFTNIDYGNYLICIIPPADAIDAGVEQECRNVTHNTNVTNASITYSDVDVLAALGDGAGSIGEDSELPEPEVVCENNAGPLGWLGCGIIEVLERGTSWFYGIVQAELHLFTDLNGDPNNSLNDATAFNDQGSVQNLWSGFRNIANGLLVIAVLIIIYSEVMGGGVLDAYNVRRMLPRLLIAVIGIQLSWVIFKEFAVIIEDIGRGLPGLLYSLWGGTPQFALSIDAGLGTVSTFGLGFYSVFAIASGAIWGLVPIAVGVLLAVFVAFVVLVIRRMVLIALLVLSPVALVLWIIPGTDEWFKRWWGTYRNLLLMYPIIQLLVALGVLMSQIGGAEAIDINSGERLPGASVIQQLIAIIAFFAPYFMIPYTFKWAGGAFASVAGMVNDRGKGIVDRSRNMAEERKNFQRMKAASEINNKDGLMGKTWQRFKSGRAVPLSPKAGSLGQLKEIRETSQAERTFGELDRYALNGNVNQIRAGKDKFDTDPDGLGSKDYVADASADGGFRKVEAGTGTHRKVSPEVQAAEYLEGILKDKSSSIGQKDAAADLMLKTLANDGVVAFRRYSEWATADDSPRWAKLDMQRLKGANAGELKGKAFDILANNTPSAAVGLDSDTFAGQAKSTHETIIRDIMNNPSYSTEDKVAKVQEYASSVTRLMENESAFRKANPADLGYAIQQLKKGVSAQNLDVDLSALETAAASRRVDTTVNTTVQQQPVQQVQQNVQPPDIQIDHSPTVVGGAPPVVTQVEKETVIDHSPTTSGGANPSITERVVNNQTNVSESNTTIRNESTTIQGDSVTPAPTAQPGTTITPNQAGKGYQLGESQRNQEENNEE